VGGPTKLIVAPSFCASCSAPFFTPARTGAEALDTMAMLGAPSATSGEEGPPSRRRRRRRHDQLRRPAHRAGRRAAAHHADQRAEPQAGRDRLRALDSRSAAPLLQQAQSQKIPVIAFDSGVDSDIPVTTAATNNKAAAAEAAKHLFRGDWAATARVALVVHDQTSRSASTAATGSPSG